jgi:hypothetical protein
VSEELTQFHIQTSNIPKLLGVKQGGGVQCFIIGNHRPIHLANLYSKHNVVVIDDEDMEVDVPDDDQSWACLIQRVTAMRISILMMVLRNTSSDDELSDGQPDFYVGYTILRLKIRLFSRFCSFKSTVGDVDIVLTASCLVHASAGMSSASRGKELCRSEHASLNKANECLFLRSEALRKT